MKAGDGAQLLISKKEVTLEWRDHLLPAKELLEALTTLARLASRGFPKTSFADAFQGSARSTLLFY